MFVKAKELGNFVKCCARAFKSGRLVFMDTIVDKFSIEWVSVEQVTM
jgi:hypothetical protein